MIFRYESMLRFVVYYVKRKIVCFAIYFILRYTKGRIALRRIGEERSMIKLRLDELLEEKGETFYWLGKETGINHAVISKLRHNRVKALRIDVMDKLCAALSCLPGDLFIYEPANLKKTSKPK